MWKKGREKMRLILDCRAANRHFVLPPSTELLSSEGFSRFEAELDGGLDLEALRLYLGIADVKDCFHRMKFEGPISEYFCYEGGYASEFGITQIDGKAVSGDTWIYPAAAVLPMGLAWSLHFAQTANVHAFTSVDCLRDARFLSDRSTAFVLSRDGPPGRYCYVDNRGVVGPRRAEIEKGLEASTRVFDGKGLLLHDRELLDDGGVSLGVHLDGKAL